MQIPVKAKGAVFSFYSATEGLGRTTEVILRHLTFIASLSWILKHPFCIRMVKDEDKVKNASKIKLSLN